MYEKIKKYYEMHLYNKEQVHLFVDKGVLTEAQYESIVGGER